MKSYEGGSYQEDFFYPESEEIKEFHSGVWADKLLNNQELPVGVAAFPFDNESGPCIRLDFEYFDEELLNFTKDEIRSFFEDNRDDYQEYLGYFESDIDPFLHFICQQVQKKIEKLLEVDLFKNVSDFERAKIFADEDVPSLSALISKTQSHERAALAHYILQKLGIESSYVCGASGHELSGESKTEHSFLVLRVKMGDDDKTETLIFDVARPHENGSPSIYKTKNRFEYDFFQKKEGAFLMACLDVLYGDVVYFGVSENDFS